MKPDFKRLRTALFCEQPDRVPLCELIVDHEIKERLLGSRFEPLKDLGDEVGFWVKAGYDYIPFFFAGYNFPGMSTHGPWAEEGKGVITNLEEFQNYPWYVAEENDYSILQRMAEDLPSSMKLVSGTAGIFERVWQLMGFKTFCMKLQSDPELIEKMFKKIGSVIFNVYEELSKHSIIGGLWISDDIAYNSGPMISPRVYRKLLFPRWEAIGDLCQEHDIPLLLHSDGNLYSMVEDLIKIGVNALHPIQPEAMDLRYLKEKYGDRLCLIGNIEVNKLSRGTPGEIRELVKDRIRIATKGGGYCLGSSNTITNYVKPENYDAMREACFAFGKYPLAHRSQRTSEVGHSPKDPP